MTDSKAIDYERMKRTMPKHKAALTRAKKTGSYSAVLAACMSAVREWDEIGAWPDTWYRWNIALGDAARVYAFETGQLPSIFELRQL
jgi:hypothetical protein